MKPNTPRIPFQLVLLTGITLMLMFFSWLKLANPNFSEISKARQSVRFYLDALGKAPIDKLGSELHPQVRDHFNVNTLQAFFKKLEILQPLIVKQLDNESYQNKTAEWRWLAQVQANKTSFPLLVAVRQPENQMIGRRWRIFALCRPDMDLRMQTAYLLQANVKGIDPQILAGIQTFQPSAQSLWRLIGTQPFTISVPSKVFRTKSLILSWNAEPDGKLGCKYTLIQSQLRESSANVNQLQ